MDFLFGRRVFDDWLGNLSELRLSGDFRDFLSLRVVFDRVFLGEI